MPRRDSDAFSDEEFSSLRRTPSFKVKNKIACGDVKVYVVNKNGAETAFNETVFEDIKPLGGGNQGKIYAAKIYFYNELAELEVRHCVLKYLQGSHGGRSKKIFMAHQEISDKDESSTEHNLIKLIEILTNDDGEIFALLPYCEIFLDSVIEKLGELIFSDPEKFEELKLLLALHVLHDLCDAFISLNLDKAFVHGDPKPANVGYYRGHWCLIDMDCAKIIGEPVAGISGTVEYMHPSSVRNRNNSSNPSNDLYAMGEIILNIFDGGSFTQSDREIVATKEKQYGQALREKYELGLTPMPFLEALNTCESVETKLIKIAEYLMQPLETNQPDILMIKAEIEKLIDQLFPSSLSFTMEQKLHVFYDSLKSTGYFRENTADGASLSVRYPSRLSLFSVIDSKRNSVEFDSDSNGLTPDAADAKKGFKE